MLIRKNQRPLAAWMVMCGLAGMLCLCGCADSKASDTTATKTAAHDHDGHNCEDHDHDHNDHSHDDHEHDHDEVEGEDGHDHDDHDHDDDDDGHDHDDHDHDHDSASTRMVPITPQICENLGITFAKVEMRRVASTIRLPGRFEARPSAVREYHSPLAGRVELLVNQYDHVTTGTPLYRLDSREWRALQQELLTAEAEVAATSASLMAARIARAGGTAAEDVIFQRIVAADGHIDSLNESIRIAQDREQQVLRLQELMGGRLSDLNEARSQLASLRNELSRAREDRAELEQQRLQLSTEGSGSAFGTTETLKAQLLARTAGYSTSRARRDLLRASIASIAGQDSRVISSEPDGQWEPRPDVEVVASAAGVVNILSVTSGSYVDSAAPILTTIDPNALRFRAVALQSDIVRLRDEMTGRILKPGKLDASDEFIPVVARVAAEADPDRRTLDLVADVPRAFAWARPGVSTEIELVMHENGDLSPAVPAGAVIQDGLEKVIFRRDPEDPDQAFRIHAELGVNDGDWVELKSGAQPGDEVVVDGIYELKLATADAPQVTGHFHADGTFHEDDH